jgi:hypothetical protein
MLIVIILFVWFISVTAGISSEIRHYNLPDTFWLVLLAIVVFCMISYIILRIGKKQVETTTEERALLPLVGIDVNKLLYVSTIESKKVLKYTLVILNKDGSSYQAWVPKSDASLFEQDVCDPRIEITTITKKYSSSVRRALCDILCFEDDDVTVKYKIYVLKGTTAQLLK